jgi:hypothetical protein
MKRLMPPQVHVRALEQLNLNPTGYTLESPEAIAAALRRAAGLLCPCASGTLARAVTEPLRGLLSKSDEFDHAVDEVIEALIAYGDLVEVRRATESRGSVATLLYPLPPAFTWRNSGTALLSGVVCDHLSALPDRLERRVTHASHVRRLTAQSGEALREELQQLGFLEIPFDQWLRTPRLQSAGECLTHFDGLLDKASPSGAIPGLLLLDSARPVTYYNGRWTEVRRHSGRYLARRPQAYGSPLWCYVQLDNGAPRQLVDLPTAGSNWRGCDEAWRLQMAIDAQRHHPQKFRIRPGSRGHARLDLFSPIPQWAQRRWDAIGNRVDAAGCLFTYEFSDSELPEEVFFCRTELWLDDSEHTAA